MKHVLNLAAVLALAVATQALAAPEPRVYFVEPTDGASVESPVTVKFGLDNFNLKPAGDTTPDSGHHHLIVDGGPIPKGEIIGASETSIHFGKAQTETQLKLSPGKHRLTLQLGDGAHQSYGPDLSASITIDVK